MVGCRADLLTWASLPENHEYIQMELEEMREQLENEVYLFKGAETYVANDS
jgi:hypothetical protein